MYMYMYIYMYIIQVHTRTHTCACIHTHTPSSGVTSLASPRKVTVQLPSPPDSVETMIFPGPTALPVRQTSFLEDTYSRERMQVCPWIDKPEEGARKDLR